MFVRRRGLNATAVQALIEAAAAQFEFVETGPPGLFTGAGAWLSANAANITRVRVSKALPITQMSFYVGTASGNVNLGVFTYAAGVYTPLSITGSTAASGTNAIQTIALVSPPTLQPGTDYALVIAADNTTITMARVGVLAALAAGNNVTVAKGSVFALNAAISSPVTQSYLPWLRAW